MLSKPRQAQPRSYRFSHETKPISETEYGDRPRFDGCGIDLCKRNSESKTVALETLETLIITSRMNDTHENWNVKCDGSIN